MAFLDNFEAYIDYVERTNQTCACKKDADGKATCSGCSAPEHNKAD